MRTDTIQLDILSERPVVRNDRTSELDIVIEIRSRQSKDIVQAGKALNLCIVIDRSGSMEGAKLETAKKSCVDILKRLDENDLFTVVVFDDEAQVIVNPQVSKSEVVTKISEIGSGGQTNLSLGWYLGLLELQTHTTDKHNNRLFLLSDGQVNAGETKKATLAQEAFKSRELGITTSTIGIGEDFQEDILEAIASESGGRFWYIHESRIEDIVDEEFKGSLSVIVDRPRVEFNPPSGVTISKELNNISKLSGKYRIRPIKGEDTFNFALRLEVNPEMIDGSDFTLEAILYDGENTLLTNQKQISLSPPQEFFVSESNPIVQSVVQQFEVTTANERVIEEMSEGSLDLMKKMLMVEVGGMRQVKDALEEEKENERALMELQYLEKELLHKERDLLITEMLTDFSRTAEVRDFLERWRKITMQGQHRMQQRHNVWGKFDEDLQAALLESAIELADLLKQRFPDKGNMLENLQEKLREHLARR